MASMAAPSFGGRRVHFVQIGLGTNTTFLQNLSALGEDWSYTIDWLLSACSERRPDKVLGISVEPSPALADRLKPHAAALPGVELVEVAIGEADQNDAELLGLSPGGAEELASKVGHWQRDWLLWDLQCLLNMSTLGWKHPEEDVYTTRIRERYGITPTLERVPVKVLSYESLARLLDFEGCEVLVVDTEGSDAQILRSLIHYCRRRPAAWPSLVQFETMGHCDHSEGHGTEWSTIVALQREGYMLVGYGDRDTHLVYEPAMRDGTVLRRWVDDWRCRNCGASGAHPYATTYDDSWCRSCRPPIPEV